MTTAHYGAAEIAAVYRVIAERRDVRHFRSDPVDPAILDRLLWAAHHGPSVGYMQPWRFIRITDASLRQRIHRLVEQERLQTADALGERRDAFMRLKVEGVRECGELLVVALCAGRERHVFGRRTLPEMDLASAACAIQNLWLAARAEGIGVGWVSMFEPSTLARLLSMPTGAWPIALLCVGHADGFDDRPLLEQEGWATRLPIQNVIGENTWPVEAPIDGTACDGPTTTSANTSDPST